MSEEPQRLQKMNFTRFVYDPTTGLKRCEVKIVFAGEVPLWLEVDGVSYLITREDKET